jgi:DNA-binding NarL/FixJ family response regulator
LTPLENDALLVEAEKAGVSCVLPKSSPTEELIRKIHGVANGEKFIAADEVRAAKSRLASSGVLALATLGETDRNILCHISNGLTDKEISQRVYLSPQTVRNRVSRLLSVLGKSNRTQLALMVSNARGSGLMDFA